jgi:hypothetical protein
MPSLLGVLETVLYVEAFERACPFYEEVWSGLSGTSIDDVRAERACKR